jgi:hypothetical protein
MLEGAADAAGLLDAAEAARLLGAANAAGLWDAAVALLSCCDAGVLHEAVGY